MSNNNNSEKIFLKTIEDSVNIIFDVGARDSSLFSSLPKEIHYFEPNNDFLVKLKQEENKNTKSIFNNFGLSDIEESITYYSDFESFYDRTKTLGGITNNKKILNVKIAKEYIIKNNIKNIDFLKIDTEGFEFKVIKGFGEYLNIVKIIQFEYGGTYLDSGVKLGEVINYLKIFNFVDFSYLTDNGLLKMTDFTDRYNYSNIVCFKK
jgi:FkbM family methyltransferase